MRDRRRVSAIHSEFICGLDSLIRLDAHNQSRYRAGAGRPNPAALSKRQLSLLTEGVFVRGFTYFETFLEETFVFYARGKKTKSGRAVVSYMNPIDSLHARNMLKGHSNFLEWNSVDQVISRTELFLEGGGPLKPALTANADKLRSIKKVRNAIAHRSPEAVRAYSSVVTSELRAPPLSLPEPGEFLLMADPRNRGNYFLISYFQNLRQISEQATA